MTQITITEIKIILFAITFSVIIGVFIALYNQNPVNTSVTTTYTGQTSVSATNATGSSDWVTSFLHVLPAPFNDANFLSVFTIFLTPIIIFLGFIALRVLKDLVTQWI
jgi:hypothetical protein